MTAVLPYALAAATIAVYVALVASYRRPIHVRRHAPPASPLHVRRIITQPHGTHRKPKPSAEILPALTEVTTHAA